MQSKHFNKGKSYNHANELNGTGLIYMDYY